MSDNGVTKRSGVDRRLGLERRNGFAVLLAGCPECGRIGHSPADMHTEGWLIEFDDEGVTFIACPEHRALFEETSRDPLGTEVTY